MLSKLLLVIFALVSGAANSCTTDGLCKTNADCCEHYICASWHPDGYHCMTGCQPNGGSCKEAIDCCVVGAVCTNSICHNGHGVEENATSAK